jgi:putative DNA primase/helicase
MNLSTVLSNFDVQGQEPDGWVARCPGHSDSHASLKIALTDQGTVLLACRAGCSFPQVMKAVPGLAQADLFNVVDDQESVKVHGGARPEVTGGPVAKLSTYLAAAAGNFPGSEAVDYVARRFGLSLDAATRVGLGFDPGGNALTFDSTGKTWRNHPRLVVPFLDFHGAPKGAQGRDLSGGDPNRWCSLTNPEGQEWTKLAVFDTGSGLDTWIVTEGPGDALTAVGAGYNAVAVRGAALKANERLVESLVQGLAGKRVIVAGDADRAGQDFAHGLAARLSVRGIEALVLSLPADQADVSAWYEANPAAFSAAFESVERNAAPPNGAGPVTPSGSSSDPDAYPLNDLGNAQRLVDSFGGDLRYAPEFGFLIYSGGVWEVDRSESVRTAAHALIDTMLSEAQALQADGRPDADKERGKRLQGHVTKSSFSNRIDAMLKEARAIRGVQVQVEHLDRHDYLVAFSNGVVDLRTGTLSPHARELLMTRRLAFDYDPVAACPRWERFLEEVFPGLPEMPLYLQRLVGYGITGETREQAFAILWGRGANGKSVFTDTLAHVFEAVSNTTPFSTFEKKASGGGIPNDLAALKGARLVFASEGEQGVPMAEATLKRVTGQDLITARFMRQEFFSFRPTFLIFLATNFRPNFRGQDEGLWRRVKLIPWSRYFRPEERDHDLVHTLKAEAEGIAAWAVRGAVDWYAQGLEDPPTIREATKSYRATSDGLDGFFPGAYVHSSNDADRVVCSDVYKRYLAWAEEEELPLKERWGRRAFYSAMEERGLVRVKRADNTYFLGLRHGDDPDPGPEPVHPLGLVSETEIENLSAIDFGAS